MRSCWKKTNASGPPISPLLTPSTRWRVFTGLAWAIHPFITDQVHLTSSSVLAVVIGADMTALYILAGIGILTVCFLLGTLAYIGAQMYWSKK